MIFLTAQPDRIKFYWQLRVQLENFREKGIDLSRVHILVGEDMREPSQEMLSLRDTGAQVFFYPYEQDYRYVSSVRPHIIKQHFQKFPELFHEYIFYTDADVIFNRLPDFSKMPLDGTWYVSDTRTYIGAEYILRDGGRTIFNDMCMIVGISPLVVERREAQSGGCQYLLTGVNAAFWEKVEKDCIKLFTSFPNVWVNNYSKYVGPNMEKYEALKEKPIQIWCADMWAVLWNAWLFHKITIIHEELGFSWANGSMWDYKRKPLFHLAGIDENSVNNENSPHFDKRKYEGRTPFGDDLSYVNPNSATYPYVQIIKRLQDANASN